MFTIHPGHLSVGLKITQHFEFLKHWWVALSLIQWISSAFSKPGCLRMCILAGAGVTPVEIQLHWVFSPGSPVNTSLKSTQTFKQTPQVIFFCCPPVSSSWLVVSHFLTFSQAAGVYSLKITFNQHKEISLARQAPPSRGCKCVHSVLPDYGWLSKIQWSSGLLAKLLFQFGAYSHIFALWQDIHWGIFG